MAKGRHELTEVLNRLQIATKVVEHPAVFTVEAMMEHLPNVDGLVTKNLFLKDKKKKLWLLTAVHSQEVKLTELAKKVGAPGGLRFADEAIMFEKLGVKQGCCTPLSIFNDENKDVRLLVDSRLLQNGTFVYSHPMENTATLGMLAEDMNRFFNETGHEPISVDFAEF